MKRENFMIHPVNPVELELAATMLVDWIEKELTPKPCAVEFRIRGAVPFSCWVANRSGRRIVVRLAEDIVRRANGANPSVPEALFAQLTAGKLQEENSTHWFPSDRGGEMKFKWLPNEDVPPLSWPEWTPIPEAPRWKFSPGPQLLTDSGEPLSVDDAQALQDAALSETPWTYLLAARPDRNRLSGRTDGIIVLQLVWSSNRGLSARKKKELVSEVSHFSTFLQLQLSDPKALAQVAWTSAHELACMGFDPENGKWPHNVTSWTSADFDHHHPELERIADGMCLATTYLGGHGDWDEAVRRLQLPPCRRTIETCWHAWVAKVLAGEGMPPLLLPLAFDAQLLAPAPSKLLRTSIDPIAKRNPTWQVELLVAMKMLKEDQKDHLSQISVSRENLHVVFDFDLSFRDNPGNSHEDTARLLTDVILFQPKPRERGKTTMAFATIRDVAHFVGVGRSKGKAQTLHVTTKFLATDRV